MSLMSLIGGASEEDQPQENAGFMLSEERKIQYSRRASFEMRDNPSGDQSDGTMDASHNLP